MRYVIIGNSAAGISAAEEIRNLDPEGKVDILTDENYPAYARCLTSYYLTGEIPEDKMFIRDKDFYTRKALRLHSGERVKRINTVSKNVLTASGRFFSYDRLLIASGSSPSMPDIPGIKTKGVFGLRTLKDAKDILFLGAQRAVVVGGGFVALKAAYALLQSGLEVTCLVSSDRVLSQMLDKEASALVAKVLTDNGLNIRCQSDVRDIVSSRGKVKEVILKTGESIKTDLVLVGKGVTPNISFLKYSGIKVERGIMVDDYLQSNLPDIYAAGDVAQAKDVVSGKKKINALWPNAVEQGKVAGRNMAGEKTLYQGSLAMNSVSFFGLSTIAAGETRAEGYEVVKLFPGPGQYRRLVFKGDRLVGYILVGNTAKAGILTELVKEGVTLGKAKEELKRGEIRQRLLW